MSRWSCSAGLPGVASFSRDNAWMAKDSATILRLRVGRGLSVTWASPASDRYCKTSLYSPGWNRETEKISYKFNDNKLTESYRKRNGVWPGEVGRPSSLWLWFGLSRPIPSAAAWLRSNPVWLWRHCTRKEGSLRGTVPIWLRPEETSPVALNDQ